MAIIKEYSDLKEMHYLILKSENLSCRNLGGFQVYKHKLERPPFKDHDITDLFFEIDYKFDGDFACNLMVRGLSTRQVEQLKEGDQYIGILKLKASEILAMADLIKENQDV